jgi:hypothetical protein
VTGAILSALWTVYPGLVPEHSERKEASIRNDAIDEKVTQRQYFQRIGSVPPRCKPKELTRRGNVFYIRVQASGFKRSEIGIRWFTYDAGNHQRLQGVRSSNRETTVFTPGVSINRQIAQVWVPWPLKSGDFYVRFELYSRDVLRAFADSYTFSVPPPRPDSHRGSWCKPLVR